MPSDTNAELSKEDQYIIENMMDAMISATVASLQEAQEVDSTYKKMEIVKSTHDMQAAQLERIMDRYE